MKLSQLLLKSNFDTQVHVRQEALPIILHGTGSAEEVWNKLHREQNTILRKNVKSIDVKNDTLIITM